MGLERGSSGAATFSAAVSRGPSVRAAGIARTSLPGLPRTSSFKTFSPERSFASNTRISGLKSADFLRMPKHSIGIGGSTFDKAVGRGDISKFTTRLSRPGLIKRVSPESINSLSRSFSRSISRPESNVGGADISRVFDGVRSRGKINLSSKPRLESFGIDYRVGMNSAVNNVGGRMGNAESFAGQRFAKITAPETKPKEGNAKAPRIFRESDYKKLTTQPKVVNEGPVKAEQKRPNSLEIRKLDHLSGSKLSPKGRQRFIESVVQRVEASQKEQIAERNKAKPEVRNTSPGFKEVQRAVPEKTANKKSLVRGVEQQKLEAIKQFLQKESQKTEVVRFDSIAKPVSINRTKAEVNVNYLKHETKPQSQTGMRVLQERINKIEQQNQKLQEIQQTTARPKAKVESPPRNEELIVAEIQKLLKTAEQIQVKANTQRLREIAFPSGRPDVATLPDLKVGTIIQADQAVEVLVNQGLLTKQQALGRVETFRKLREAGLTDPEAIGQIQLLEQVRGLKEKVKDLELLEEEEKKRQELIEEEKRKRIKVETVYPIRDEEVYNNRNQAAFAVIKEVFKKKEAVEEGVDGKEIADGMPEETADLRSTLRFGLSEPDYSYIGLIESLSYAGKFETPEQAAEYSIKANAANAPGTLGYTGIPLSYQQFKTILIGEEDPSSQVVDVYSEVHQELVKVKLELIELMQKVSLSRIESIEED